MASLVADYGESSGSQSSEDSDTENTEAENSDEKAESTANQRLPPPTFTDKIKNSVFVNPFLEAENAKFAVLEKHVKMVPQSNDKDHKKTCWMFKKGNCRFGKKCRFVHHQDDTTNIISQLTATKDDDSKEVNTSQNHLTTEWLESHHNRNNSDNDEDEPPQKKKRPGLTQGLVPGKRVMAMYRKQKENSF